MQRIELKKSIWLDFVHLSALRASGYLTCSRVNFMQVGYLTHLNKIHSLRGKWPRRPVARNGQSPVWPVFGIDLNERTGCRHYASSVDIIAVKFKCCNHYFACYDCHTALAGHKAKRWRSDEFHAKAILCGHCYREMSIWEYLTCGNVCMHCRSFFNPRCYLHWGLYFEFTSVTGQSPV